LDARVKKLEKAVGRMAKDGYSELVDIISGKMEQDLGMYLPKV